MRRSIEAVKVRSLRLPQRLDRRVERVAVQSHRSFNQQVVELLEQALAAKEEFSGWNLTSEDKERLRREKLAAAALMNEIVPPIVKENQS